jgi:hypothetical protein
MNCLAFHRLSASLDLSKTSKSMLEKPWRCTVGQGDDAASVAGPAYMLGRWRQRWRLSNSHPIAYTHLHTLRSSYNVCLL